MKHAILTYFFLTSLLWSCAEKESAQENSVQSEEHGNIVKVSAQQSAAAKITLGQIEKKPIRKELQLNGMIEVPPQNMIVLSPPVGGFVKAIHVREGMQVKKGDALVTLENMEYIQLQQDYLESLSKLEYLLAEYERQKALAAENINAAKSVQLAKSNFESLNGIVKGLEAKLKLMNISRESLIKNGIRSHINLYAGTSGYVSEVEANMGQFFSAAQPMLKIVDLDHIHILLHVYEKDLALIKIGQEVVFNLPNSTDPFEANVYLIGKEITPERTIRIHCHLKDEKVMLIPGMYVTATVVVDAFEADVVPVESVVTFGKQQIIFTAPGKEGEFHMIEVKTGQTTGNYVEIFPPDGLGRSTPVVTKGANALLGMLKNNPDD